MAARAVVNGIQTSPYTISPNVPNRFTGSQTPFVVTLSP
jgi:hypothetical protein